VPMRSRSRRPMATPSPSSSLPMRPTRRCTRSCRTTRKRTCRRCR
jgi:hypothetical protein